MSRDLFVQRVLFLATSYIETKKNTFCCLLKLVCLPTIQQRHYACRCAKTICMLNTWVCTCNDFGEWYYSKKLANWSQCSNAEVLCSGCYMTMLFLNSKSLFCTLPYTWCTLVSYLPWASPCVTEMWKDATLFLMVLSCDMIGSWELNVDLQGMNSVNIKWNNWFSVHFLNNTHFNHWALGKVTCIIKSKGSVVSKLKYFIDFAYSKAVKLTLVRLQSKSCDTRLGLQ